MRHPFHCLEFMSLIKQTDQIPDAATVRRLLKAKGYTEIKVKRTHSPFSGDTFFDVTAPTPPGVAVITDSGTEHTPGGVYSSDGGATAGKLQSLADACKLVAREAA
jgi:hypothetical protein